MNHFQFAMIAAVLVVGAKTVTADDEPIRVKLDKSISSYDIELEKYSLAVVDSFEKRIAAARRHKRERQNSGRPQIKSEQQAFDEKGAPPKSLPRKITSLLSIARVNLESAYNTAIREYTKAGKDDLASAVQNELEVFLRRRVPPKDAVRYKAKAYKVFAAQVTWHGAETECKRLAGHLAVVEGDSQNAFLTKLAADAKLSAIWLGASDEKSDGQWLSTADAPLKYENWEKGQPNYASGIEHFAVLIVSQQGLWWDYPADPKAHPKLTQNGLPGYVCQWD